MFKQGPCWSWHLSPAIGGREQSHRTNRLASVPQPERRRGAGALGCLVVRNCQAEFHDDRQRSKNENANIISVSGRIRPRSALLPLRVDSNSGALPELSQPGDAHSTSPWKTCRGVDMPRDLQLYAKRSLIKAHSLKLHDTLQCFPANCIKALQTQDTFFHALRDTSVQFQMPSGLKTGITLELRTHVQLNYPIRSSTILSTLIPLLNAIQYSFYSTSFSSSY